MGKEKYLAEIEKLFDKSPVVLYSSIERIIRHKTKAKQYPKKLIGYLIKKGKIKRLSKGIYTSKNDSSLLIFYFQPAYLGLQDALSFHNLWEQETIPIIITSRQIRQGIRPVLGTNLLIRRINKKYIFGIEYKLENNVALPYSDIEKTFIDMVYFRQPMSKSTLSLIKKRISKKKLSAYLNKYPVKMKNKVLALLS